MELSPFDIGSASVDQIAQSIAVTMERFSHLPFYPLTGPGMPLPGPDFIEHACAMGDPKPVVEGKKAGKRLVHHGPILQKLYQAALYDPDFYLPIRVKGRHRIAQFTVGHRWAIGSPVDGPSHTCEIMIIGKCLGLEEEKSRRNFVGKSGEELANVLAEFGFGHVRHRDVYVTNLIHHANLDPTKQRLSSGWVRNCGVLLEQEIRLVRPKFILCLGSETSSYLLSGEVGGVSASQGRIMTKRVPVNMPGEPEEWHEFKFMTCIHPAAVVRTPDRKPEFRGTIQRFVGLTSGAIKADSVTEAVDHRVVWTVEDLKQLVDDVIAEHHAGGRKSQPIAIDCEWHGEFWSSTDRPLKGPLPDGKRTVPESKGEKESWLRTFQFSHKPGFAATVVLRNGGPRSRDGDDRIGLPAFVPSIGSAVEQIKRLVTSTPDRHVRPVGQHLRADLPWLCRLDKELGEILIRQFDAPLDDEDPDGVTRLYGWQKARWYGGFDTMYAIHAHQETAEKKLEVAAMNLCGVRRYDTEVIRAKDRICKELGIKPGKLPGYGEIPDEVLHPYGNWDVDATIRLYEAFTKEGGFLDKDQYGNSSWLPFWLSQQKLTAELEMEMAGLLIDHGRAEELTGLYKETVDQLLDKLQVLIGWPGFNPNSVQQVRTVLFNPGLSGKVDSKTGDILDPRPEVAQNCVILNLDPVKTSGKPSKSWDKVVSREQQNQFTPSTDKESLGILLAKALAREDTRSLEILKTLRWYRFTNRVVTGVLCPPSVEAGVQFDEDGDMVFEKGLMASVEWDWRVRTHFMPVDTGRVGSSRPPIQNLSKRREKDLRDILGTRYSHPLRSIIMAPPGHVLVEADFTGAELLMMAIQSGSAKMVDHCLRSNLKDSDPLYYDIHSNVAKTAFHFDGPPTKKWLKANNLEHLRDIAKTIAFGIPYGRGDEAVVRAVEELGIRITVDDVAKIRFVLFGEYPELESFFEGCRGRVLKPGWMRTCYGRLRRFQDPGGSEEVLAEMQRVAGNFNIQGGVADALALALRLLRHYPNRYLPDGTPKYTLVAQIHDAVMAAVRVEHLGWYVHQVLPDCLERGVTVYACDLDGNRLPGREGYHMGHEASVYVHWGEAITREEGLAIGVPEEFLPKPKAA